MAPPIPPDAPTESAEGADDEGFFGRRLVQEKLLTETQVAQAIKAQRTLRREGRDLRLGEILVERGLLTHEQVRRVLLLAGKQVLHCPRCGNNFNVIHWSPDRQVLCPSCGVQLVPPPADRTIDALETHAGTTPPDAATSAPGSRSFGRYRLLAELGRGGMGVVWRAWDTELRRTVALKQILSEGNHDSVTRFVREAQAAARLRHPNIVAVHDVGIAEGQHFLTTDFVEGQSLERLAAQGLPIRRSVDLVRQIADALHHAHGHGIVHRDVKPANILVDSSGHPYITDFGLAKEVGPAPGEALTLSGDLLGTPAYMSPEQAQGAGRVGPPSDQFSLGVVLYELIAGRRPFEGVTLFDLLRNVMERDPDPPSRFNGRIHRDLETVCLKSMEKDPARRYASSAEMAADLGRWTEGEPIVARPVSLPTRVMRKAAKHRRALLAMSAAVVLLAAGGGWFWRRQTERMNEVEEQSARSRARDQELLRKAGLAHDVLARWVPLAGTIQGLEETYFDWSLSEEERAARLTAHAAEVQEFLDKTPDNPTSRSTALALAGWARVLAGDATQGLAWMKEARGLDPDLPYGALMEALASFWDYQSQAPLPEVRVATSGVTLGPAPPETAEMGLIRKRLDRLLAEASHAAVWGEGLARDFRSAVAGLVAAQAGRLEEAEARLAEALRSDALRGVETSVDYALARTRYLATKFEEGAQDMRRVAARRPGSEPVKRALGQFLLAAALARRSRGEDPMETLRDAAAALDDALRLVPEDDGALKTRAAVRRMQGDLAGAAADLSRVIELGDDSAAVRNMRGLVFEESGNFPAAMEEYDAAVRADPHYVPALVSRALSRFVVGDLDAGLADAAEAVRADPACAEAWFARGTLRRGKGDLVGAIEDYDATLRLRPGLVSALLNRGLARADRGESKAALDDAEACLSKDPRGVAALALRGRMRWRLGDRPGGMEDLDQAIALSRDPSLLHERAMVRAATGDLAGARADLDEVVAAEPKNALALAARGVVREGLGELAEAIGDLEAALALNPSAPLVHQAIGHCLYAGGDLWGAREEFIAEVRRDPSCTSSLVNLAVCLHALEDPDGSRSWLKKAEAVAPKDPHVQDNCAIFRLIDGDLAAAEAGFQAAMARPEDRPMALLLGNEVRRLRGADGVEAETAWASDPAFASAYAIRGNVRRSFGRLPEALADLDIAVALSSDSAEVRCQRAAVRAVAGDAAGAEADLDAAATARPAYLRTWVDRAELREARGDREGAIGDWKRALALARPSWPRRAEIEARIARER